MSGRAVVDNDPVGIPSVDGCSLHEPSVGLFEGGRVVMEEQVWIPSIPSVDKSSEPTRGTNNYCPSISSPYSVCNHMPKNSHVYMQLEDTHIRAHVEEQRKRKCRSIHTCIHTFNHLLSHRCQGQPGSCKSTSPYHGLEPSTSHSFASTMPCASVPGHQ